MTDTHPIAFLRSFAKSAESDRDTGTSIARNYRYGVGDSITNRFVPKTPQGYTQITPANTAARPTAVASQQQLPPPPVQ